MGKYVIFVLCSFYSIAIGEDFAKSFLRISPDAVSRSIGGFNQAYSIGAIDLFINPALLSQHTKKELQFSNIIDLLSNQYASFAFSTPLGNTGHVGFGLVGRMNSNLPENGTKGVNIRNYNHYQFAMIIGYSRNLSPFSIGMNIKYFRLGYDEGEFYKAASAVGLDLGIHYILSKAFSIGFNYQTPVKLRWDNNARQPAPGRMGLGITWMPSYISDNFLRILLSSDQFVNEPIQINFGIILTPVMNKLGLKSFTLRSGIGNFDLDSHDKTSVLDNLTDSAPVLTIGAGLGIDTGTDWGINLDYCFQVKEYITNQHIITTRIRF